MLGRLKNSDLMRRFLLSRSASGPLHDYLAVPLAARQTGIADTRYLALDMETTGGDANKDAIVSLGWVCLEGLRIDLSTARHCVVRLNQPMTAESAVIHKITDDESAAGSDLGVAVSALLADLAGRVMIAHRAKTELDFLRQACKTCFGATLPILAVDTLDLAIRARRDAPHPIRPGDLRLGALRHQHHLPRYPVHHALSDALAAAELFLAQLSALPHDTALARVLYAE